MTRFRARKINENFFRTSRSTAAAFWFHLTIHSLPQNKTLHNYEYEFVNTVREIISVYNYSKHKKFRLINCQEGGTDINQD